MKINKLINNNKIKFDKFYNNLLNKNLTNRFYQKQCFMAVTMEEKE